MSKLSPSNTNWEHFNWYLCVVFKDKKGQNGVLLKALNKVAVVGLCNLAER